MAHGSVAGLMICALVGALIIVCYWRLILVLFICTAISFTLLGLVEVLAFLAH
jgi:hypothetical protein